MERNNYLEGIYDKSLEEVGSYLSKIPGKKIMLFPFIKLKIYNPEVRDKGVSPNDLNGLTGKIMKDLVERGLVKEVSNGDIPKGVHVGYGFYEVIPEGNNE